MPCGGEAIEGECADEQTRKKKKSVIILPRFLVLFQRGHNVFVLLYFLSWCPWSFHFVIPLLGFSACSLFDSFIVDGILSTERSVVALFFDIASGDGVC